MRRGFFAERGARAKPDVAPSAGSATRGLDVGTSCAVFATQTTALDTLSTEVGTFRTGVDAWTAGADALGGKFAGKSPDADILRRKHGTFTAKFPASSAAFAT
ncbi:MAG: hypothetical protein QM790_20960 [Nibricoccus sp.]